ncbi:CMP-N-acetylneuraminate-beta-galactosamide-alpha-2,3-sialyltransferase 1-like [Pyrus ussuriensis x Pyrus communis]|uniref:CMP-N-acetylneuraminate-beta-galactosamide-alpha-2,3-sialyltransferase 1-like n=1 Tax=Pyrus ussuriensis x Pyrus communis TaxID=2448454 RepID=A0A5N5FY24_9ROSA|nr:CMP-N-acetylneuraminate-beta-galactosamide-alpha-2,3-sialyltransferase 1-like [Pyrus ussuriensis x Pyrus communis]
MAAAMTKMSSPLFFDSILSPLCLSATNNLIWEVGFGKHMRFSSRISLTSVSIEVRVRNWVFGISLGKWDLVDKWEFHGAKGIVGFGPKGDLKLLPWKNWIGETNK